MHCTSVLTQSIIFVSMLARAIIMSNSRNFTIRISDELREKLEKDAKEQGRSIGNYITFIINEYYKNKEKEEKDD